MEQTASWMRNAAGKGFKQRASPCAGWASMVCVRVLAGAPCLTLWATDVAIERSPQKARRSQHGGPRNAARGTRCQAAVAGCGRGVACSGGRSLAPGQTQVPSEVRSWDCSCSSCRPRSPRSLAATLVRCQRSSTRCAIFAGARAECLGAVGEVLRSAEPRPQQSCWHRCLQLTTMEYACILSAAFGRREGGTELV
jgi:hypothetical protein